MSGRICLLPILLCAFWSLAHCQQGCRSSRGMGVPRDKYLDTGVPVELTKEAVGGAKRNTMHEEQPISDPSCEDEDEVPGKHIWNMVHPCREKVHPAVAQAVREELEASGIVDTPGSLDEALTQLREVMAVVSDSHNAILEKKIEGEPFLQRLWIRFLYSFGDPFRGIFAGNQDTFSSKQLSSLSDSAKDFVKMHTSDGVQENADAVANTFRREVLLSLSALKNVANNAAHGGWLVTSDTQAYLDGLKSNFNLLTEKWLVRMGDLAGAAQPYAESITSNEYVQKRLTEVEAMVVQFREELWRTRTEWTYHQYSAVSWATDSLRVVREKGMDGVDRLSESVHAQMSEARNVFNDGLRRSRAHVAYLQTHAAKRVNHFADLLVLWIDINNGFFITLGRMLKDGLEKSWRLFAFVIVIALFRFLLGFVQTDGPAPYYVSRAFSRVSKSFSAPTSDQPHTNRRHIRPQAPSSPGSESSESIPETALDDEFLNPEVIINSAAQRRTKRTPWKGGMPSNAPEVRPFTVSNSDYQTTLLNSRQKNGNSISIGDHEVQLVYETTPATVRNQEKRRTSARKRTPKSSKTAAARTISPAEEMAGVTELLLLNEEESFATAGRSEIDSSPTVKTRLTPRRMSARLRKFQ